jgi:hypothetical protein
MLRIDATFKDMDSDKLFAYWTSDEIGNQQGIKEYRCLKKVNDETIIYYGRFAMPLMSDRDCISLMQKKPVPDGKGFYMSVETVEYPDMPPIPGVCRMFNQNSIWVRPDAQDPTLCHYTEFSAIDMKGKIPVYIANLMMTQDTSYSLQMVYDECGPKKNEKKK